MKKKLWITSLLAALSITAAAGGVALAKEQPLVTDAAENWQVGTIDNSYAYGTSFEVPAATVEVGGETVEATATVTYPSGLTVVTQNIPLNQAGKYTVTYRAVVGDMHCVEEKTFNVVNKSYLVQSESSSVTYGKYTKYGSNSNGLQVRLAKGDTLSFSQLIDVDKMTETDALLDLFITPDMLASYDFSRLIMTFTDAIDPTQYVRFQLRRYAAEDRGFGTSYVDVSVNGQAEWGQEKGVYRTGWFGSPFVGSFSATQHKGGAWMGDLVQLTPDINSCKIMYNPLTMETKVRTSHIAYLNDPALFEDIWEGWPSGQAKLTITADELKGETANFCIKSVFGVDLANDSFVETDAPIVTPSLADADMPKGEVGQAYKIPTAASMDSYSGVCETKMSVYRDFASASPISVGVVNGAFTPTVAGWHTIVYTAKDALGNEGKAYRNVYVAEDLGEIEITLPDSAVSSANLGSWVPVDVPTYTGDCGSASVKATVTFNGEEIEVVDGFRPEVAGEYKVTYTVTDYIGRTGTAEYTVEGVAAEGYVLLEKLILPQIFVSDYNYTLPALKANTYVSGSCEQTLCDVVITDKNGEKTYKAGDTFKPSVAENGDKVTVAYTCGGSVLTEREIPAVIVQNGDKIIAKNYVYGENITTSYKDENEEWYNAGAAIIANEDSALCGWTFATPQFVNNFSLVLEGIANRTKFDGLVITLTDSVNEAESISLTLMKKGNGTTASSGSTSIDITTTSLAVNKQYTIKYADGRFTFADMNIPVKTTVNGEAFTGFSSSLAYLRVEMINAKKDAAYKIRTVNDSNITRRNQEIFAPNFQILGSFGGNLSLNQVYEIFPAIANDVFAPQVNITMTVIAPDGSVVTDNNGTLLQNVPTDKSYFIIASQYGKYDIAYSVVEKDWVTANPLNVTKSVFVVDEVAPQVRFTNATQTTAKVGDVITCPDVVFQDNVTANEDMLVVRGVFTALGQYMMFEDGENAIKCSYAGDYKFIVMVYDAFGNMSSVTHTITVTAK